MTDQYRQEMGDLTEKLPFLNFIFTSWNYIEIFSKPKSFSLPIQIKNNNCVENFKIKMDDFRKMLKWGSFWQKFDE